MSRSLLLVVTVAGVFVISGCLGVLGGERTATAIEPPPSTEAAVPTAPATSSGATTETPTPSVAGLPPATSVEWFDSRSPARMVDTHEATLRNTSFTIRFRRVRFTNGMLAFHTNGTARYDGNGTFRFEYTVFDAGPGGESTRTVDVWTNGTTARRMVTTDNGSSVEDTRLSATHPTFAGPVASYLRLFRTDVTGYSRLGGELTVRISGSEIRNAKTRSDLVERRRQFGFRKVQDGEFSVEFVDTHISRYRVRVSGHALSQSITVIEDVAFEAVGSTTVERPTWIGTSNTSRPG